MIICTTFANTWSYHQFWTWVVFTPKFSESLISMPENNCPIWPRFFWDLWYLGPFFMPRNRNRSTQLPHPEIQRHRSSECRGWSTRQKNAGARPKVSASSDKAPTKARAKKTKSVLAMQCGDEFMCYTSYHLFDIGCQNHPLAQMVAIVSLFFCVCATKPRFIQTLCFKFTLKWWTGWWFQPIWEMLVSWDYLFPI